VPDQHTGLLALLPPRLAWAAVCVGAVVLLQSLFRQPVGPALALGMAALVVLAAWRPFDALLVLAGLGPLSSMLFSLGRGTSASIQFAEALTLAFIAGWSARRAATARPLAVPGWLAAAAVLLMMMAGASAVVETAVLRAQTPSEPFADLLTTMIIGNYLQHLPGSAPLTAPLLLIEGLLLMLIAADSCAGVGRRRDAVLRCMLFGAAAAAALNVLRLVMVAVQRGTFLQSFFELLATARVNVHYGDRNAAGSYFAMMLLVATGYAARMRVAAIPCALLIALGVWMSGSRIALAAVILSGLTGVLLARLQRTGRKMATVYAGAGLLAVAAVALWAFYPEGRNLAAGKAFGIRSELAQAGLRMAADRPVFGVGVSRYYDLSSEYAGEALALLGFERENAHNMFVQVLAELGVPGLILFLAILGLAFREGLRGYGALRGPSIGLVCGLLAYILTCLGGHPLLVPEAAYPFWMALGLAAAPLLTTASGLSPAAGIAAIALGALVTLSVPFRFVEKARTADVANVALGLSVWHHSEDGVRYRWAGDYSSFFVPGSARAVRLPLRNGFVARSTVEVRIFLDGREADRVTLPADDLWREKRLMLRPRGDPPAFYKVELRVGLPGGGTLMAPEQTGTGGLVMVGRPIVEQSQPR
jgi:O-antigen ligase